jgi:hypothetical protein
MHGVLLLNTVRQHVEETITKRSTPTCFASCFAVWTGAYSYGDVFKEARKQARGF